MISPAPPERSTVVFDAARAIWLPGQRVLAVADLHLGYAWAHRHGGQMVPLSAHETTTQRLLALIEKYGATEVALLGDIVHRAAPVAAIERGISELCGALDCKARTLRLIIGNHDRGIEEMLARCGVLHGVASAFECGPHLLLHGDGRDPARAREQLDAARNRGGKVIMGHEHPAIRLGDGVTSIKCPCFLEAPDLIVLPAFSDWAAGCNVRKGQFLSALAEAAAFSAAHAILAGKVLKVSLT